MIDAVSDGSGKKTLATFIQTKYEFEGIHVHLNTFLLQVMALRFAREGADVLLAAKMTENMRKELPSEVWKIIRNFETHRKVQHLPFFV